VRRRDQLLVWNERVKLIANAFNAIALGLIAFAVLRPATEDIALLSRSSAAWAFGGLVLHGLAHYVLRYLRKEVTNDEL
jgi:hypothetical protein